MMNLQINPLQVILFGNFTPPPVATTRSHRILQRGDKPVPAYVPPKPPRPRSSPVRDKILTAVRKWPGLTATEYATKAGVAKGVVRSNLVKLKADGLVRHVAGSKRFSGGGRTEGAWHPKGQA